MSEEIKEILDRIKYIVDNPTYEDVYYEGVNRCVDGNPNYTALDSKESKLLLDYITNIQQENQKLEKENKELNRMCELYSQSLYNADLTKAEDEIERLNNIINELEKFMDEDYEYYKKYGYAEQGHAMGQIRRIKNKLQELKGSDKE